ncbi:sphingosine N-acyltransferase lag1 [Tritrichomonas musculus]|uniref:Sphingosine N-acyltransferase lag1 n=1 Tax=Tritrichomonas musculus TaxID=1915356 RepID=A0ABR2HI24_9EUKA
MFEYLNELTSIGLNDFPLFLGVCAVSGIVRLFLTYCILTPISKRITFKSEFVRFKFIHRGFDFIHFSFSTITGFLALMSRPYYHCFYYTFNCGKEFVQQAEPTDRVILSRFEKFYYMIFTAYYIVDVFFIWTNTTDRRILMLHHFISVTLILNSIYIRTQVIGVCVLLLHDVVDAPLYLGKVCTYLQFKKMQDIALLVFAAACTWFRIICLPGVIVYAFITVFKHNPDHYPFYCLEAGILLILLYCHLYWFKRIVMAAINIFTQGADAICDNRSDGPDNDEDEVKKDEKQIKKD